MDDIGWGQFMEKYISFGGGRAWEGERADEIRMFKKPK